MLGWTSPRPPAVNLGGSQTVSLNHWKHLLRWEGGVSTLNSCPEGWLTLACGEVKGETISPKCKVNSSLQILKACTVKWGSGDIQTADSEDCVWVNGPTEAGVYAEGRVLYCHQRSHRSPGLGLQPEVLVVFGLHTAIGTNLTWVVCASTQYQNVLSSPNQAAAKGHVWVSGPAAAVVCVVVWSGLP